jgi:hypothetical protein
MTSGLSAFACVSSAVKSCWSAVTPKVPRICPPFSLAYFVKYSLWPGHQFRGDLVLVDHRAVDPMHFRIFGAVGDVGENRAPDHHRQPETVIGLDRRDRGGRAIMGGGRDHRAVGAGLRRHLHRDIGLALVVEHDQLIFVLRLGVGVAQLHRELGRIAGTDAVGGHAAGERTDEGHLGLVLGRGRQRRQGQGNSQADRCGNGGQSLFPDHLSLSLWWERAPAAGRPSA